MTVKPRPQILSSHHDKCVLIIDGDLLFVRSAIKRLNTAGIMNIHFEKDPKSAFNFLKSNSCDFILIDIDVGTEGEGFQFLELLRIRGYGNHVATMSQCPSQEAIIQAAVCGANDFWVKSMRLDIVSETLRLLQTRTGLNRSCPSSPIFESSGFLQSMGLSASDIALLKEYSKGFPRYTELANRIGRPSVQVRKQFSEIYKKLHNNLNIENPAQLSSLITIFSLFR